MEMNADASKAVLITGCSSGIGRATAQRLARSGWNVYASARRIESISDLATEGCKLLPLDVTDEDSMRTAVEKVKEDTGAVGVLINTRATRSRERSKTLPWNRSAGSSKPTSSVW